VAVELFSPDLDLSPWTAEFTGAFELFWQISVDSETGVVFDVHSRASARASAMNIHCDFSPSWH